MPDLTCWSGMSSTATEVASEPVPDVVGHDDQRLERRGRLAPAADRRVDVVHDRRGVGGDEVGDLRRVHARAAADADEAVEVAVDRDVGGRLERLDGRLDVDVVEDTISMPSASIRSRTLSVIPAAITPGSDTTMTRLAPSRLSSQPVSAEAPGPNLIGVASMVKTVSWRGAPSRRWS